MQKVGAKSGAVGMSSDADLVKPIERLAVTQCGSGGIGRHTILRGWRRKAWGFKSPLPHQTRDSHLHYLVSALQSLVALRTGVGLPRPFGGELSAASGWRPSG